jgi:hypothetical protein
VNDVFISQLQSFLKFAVVDGTTINPTLNNIYTVHGTDVVQLPNTTLRKGVKDYIRVNNITLARNGNFAIDTDSNGLADNWVAINLASYNIKNGEQEFFSSGSASMGVRQPLLNALPAGRKLYVSVKHASNAIGTYGHFFNNNNTFDATTPGPIMKRNSSLVTLTAETTDIRFTVSGTTSLNTWMRISEVMILDIQYLYEKGIIPHIPTTAAEFEQMIIEDELDLVNLNLIKRIGEDGAILAEPVVTPIPVQNDDYTANNYGMELYEHESPVVNDITSSYYRDTAAQVDTNASLMEDILARLAVLESQ